MTDQRAACSTMNEAPDVDSRKLPQYMTSRSGVWYFKRKLPADVLRLMDSPKEQIWKSLSTTCEVEASKRLKDCLVEFDAMVAGARLKSISSRRKPQKPRAEGTTKYLLAEHIPVLLERFAFSMLETDDMERKANGRIKDKEAKRAMRQERLSMMEDGLKNLLELAADEDYVEHEEVVQQLLSDERLIAPPGSKVRTELLKKLLRKDIELIKAQRDRLLGEDRETPAQRPVAPRELPTLLDLHSKWKKARKNARTVTTYLGFVQQFESMHGALPVTAIRGTHVEAYRDALAKKGLTRETIRNHVTGLATLVHFNRRRSADYSSVNPFEDISFLEVPESDSDEDRRAYEVSELQQLFSSRLYTEGYRPSGQSKEAGFWAPLMGPFVGARLEEVAQLRVADIQRINGDWVIRISDLDANQHLKTKSSFRLVPVHLELIKCGFLVYVASLKTAGQKRLFPSLKNENQNKRWSGSLGSWYGRYMDGINLSDPRLDYHSFRFLFKQRCSQCGIKDEIRDALTGHWLYQNAPSRGYMRAEHRQYPLPDLVSAMKLLRYDELDLTHLHVEDPMLGVTA